VELVKRDLSTLAARTEPFQVGAGRAFRMRQGVGINLGSGAKKASILHDALRSAWLDFLSEQDKGTWRPHWTVQNKENDEGRRDEAMLDVETVIRKEDVAGRALGFDLWKYDNGNWVLEKEVVFGGSKNWMGS
jgi:mannose-1-phosphate guanylyltransferase